MIMIMILVVLWILLISKGERRRRIGLCFFGFNFVVINFKGMLTGFDLFDIKFNYCGANPGGYSVSKRCLRHTITQNSYR